LSINPFGSNKKNEYTALDFAHNSLNMVHCAVEGEEVVLYDWSKQRIPAGTINDGIIDNQTIIKTAVNNLLEEIPYKKGKFIISPAPGQEFLHRMQISGVEEEDLQDVIHNMLESHLSLFPKDVYCDHVILAKEDDTWDILLLAIPTGVLDGYKNIFADQSFYPQVANFQSLALISLLSYQNKLAEASLILNMDTVNSRVTIAAEGEFFLDKITGLGGEDLAWMTRGNKKGWNKEDRSHMKSALSTDEIEEDSETEKIAVSIKKEIEEAIIQQSNKYPDKPVENIYLTGGGFKLQGLKDYLAARMDYNIALLDPLENIRLDREKNSPGLSKLYRDDKNMMSRALGLVISEVLYDEG